MYWPHVVVDEKDLRNRMFLIISHNRSLACMPLELAELPDPNDGKSFFPLKLPFWRVILPFGYEYINRNSFQQ